MLDAPQNLAALGLDNPGSVPLQSVSERIVCRDEEPGVETSLGQGACGAGRDRVGIVDPKEAVRRTALAYQFGRTRCRRDINLVFVAHELLNSERHRGIAEAHDNVDASD